MSGIKLQNTEPLTGEVMVKPIEIRSVTRPGSNRPISSGRQPAWRSRALARVRPTISHSAAAASTRRKTTNSPTVISATANLVAGVADDHRHTAASMARLASAFIETVTAGLGGLGSGGFRFGVGNPNRRRGRLKNAAGRAAKPRPSPSRAARRQPRLHQGVRGLGDPPQGDL